MHKRCKTCDALTRPYASDDLDECGSCRRVRVLRTALEEITEANEQTPVKTYQRMEEIARAALATTEPEDV